MGFYAPYVPVAKRRAKARKKMEALRKKGRIITPIELAGRKIATTFWGKGWCDHMESFSDHQNRLPRGRTYVRNGSVCHLDINTGEVKAIVSGSALYNVRISIHPLSKIKWTAIKAACTGRVGSLLDLLNGTLSEGVMAVVTDRTTGLFPLSNEIDMTCDCADWAGMCKHVAAVLYGVGARLDDDPQSLFVLRGVDYEELLDVSTHVIDETLDKGTGQRVTDEDSLSELFGIELGEVPSLKSRKPKAKESLTTKPKIAKALPRYYSGLNLKKLRGALGLTQKEMAKMLKVSVAKLSRFESQGRKKVVFSVEIEKNVNHLWLKNKD